MLHRIAISLLCLIQVFALEAHLVSGRVYDTASELPLVGVSVAVLNSQQGTITGTNGEFTLNCNLGDTLKMTAIGYETATMPITALNAFINVPMTQKPIGLNEVVVKGGKYSKKNNPAVELAKKLIASRNSRRLNNCDYFEREKYQRMAYGLNDFDNRKDNHVLNRYPFLAEYADTVTLRLIARPVLPVSIDENVAQESLTDNSITSTTQEKLHVGIDDSFDIEGIKTLVEQLIGDTDIFQNDIQCLNYRFMSPIADMGTQFYKYFLADTLDVDGEQCVELQFVPFNTQDLGFVGRMYVTCDSSLFIKRVELNFPQNINLNFIGAFTVSIAYMRAPGNAHAKTDEDAIVEFSIFKNAQTLFARHTSKFTKYAFTPNHNGTMSISSIDDYAVRGKLTAKKLNQMIARLRSNKQFFWSEVVIKALVQDYFPTTADPRKSPVDIGPISSTFASNELEGFITRLGATTTPALNKHFSADAYVAYGWKDHKLKYGASATISFNERKAFKCEKPYNALTLSHGFGSHLLGNDFMFTPADNQFFTLLTRKPDDKRLYLHATS
ncbi:MAG: carboxypeptidase-like regulatory domain-containing protein, partial [Muribaculaceae bacterium]|nr:carboxypeptidase-like regulatory domain-containing protein [Muribaculaceae bacterium]